MGAALGIAGALIQGHTRNPLADPGILGVTAGAACAVVLAIFGLGIATPLGYIWFALLGAFLASALVFGLSAIGTGKLSPLTLVLGGSAIGAFLTSVTSAVVLLDQNTLDSYRFWVVGSIAGRGLDILTPLLPFLVVGLVLALATTPGLNLLSLGEDVARSLGISILANRIAGIVAITLLTGAATAACGPIAFVGLVVPHVARAISGPDYRWIVPFSGLLGAIVLVMSDVIGRVVVRPGELQVGIVLAVVGAPFFIALVRRQEVDDPMTTPLVATRPPFRVGAFSTVWRPKMVIANVALVGRRGRSALFQRRPRRLSDRSRRRRPSAARRWHAGRSVHRLRSSAAAFGRGRSCRTALGLSRCDIPSRSPGIRSPARTFSESPPEPAPERSG